MSLGVQDDRMIKIETPYDLVYVYLSMKQLKNVESSFQAHWLKAISSYSVLYCIGML
jgi:hypothetical protein